MVFKWIPGLVKKKPKLERFKYENPLEELKQAKESITLVMYGVSLYSIAISVGLTIILAIDRGLITLTVINYLATIYFIRINQKIKQKNKEDKQNG